MEMVIAEFPQVAIVDMEYLWTKCIPNAVDRGQVENKFTWGDKIMHGKNLLQFCNIIQRHIFTSLTIDMIWICLLKMLITKSAMYYITSILIRQIQRSCQEVPEKDVLYQCFSCFPFSTEQTSFRDQEEADTQIFYYAKILDQRHNVDTIVIDAKDTDVIVIAAYVFTILEKKLIRYRKKQQIKCSDLC